jgi:SAM-dependent methyltransferase
MRPMIASTVPVLMRASTNALAGSSHPDGFRRAGAKRENAGVTEAEATHDWDGSYAGPSPPPWDIGRPQAAFVHLADRGALTGALLDAGCGTGEHTILAASRGARALGIDVSSRAIGIARLKSAERGVDASFQILDALRLDTLGAAFDTIIDSGLFHVFDDTYRARYVAAVHAVLRPGGHFHLMSFSDRQPGDWGPRRVTDGELRAAFDSGWSVTSLTPARFDLNPGLDTPTAAAWLADVVRLAPQ